MNRLVCLAVLSISALLVSCSNPISYGSDFNSTISFDSFTSYAWAAPNEHNDQSNAYIADDLVDARIRTGVDEQLADKGFTKINDETAADFLVNYSVLAEDRIDINTYNTYGGYSVGYGGYGGYGSYGAFGTYGRYPYQFYGVGTVSRIETVQTEIEEFRQGTLVLDIINPEDNKLMWRGTAEARLSATVLSAQEKDELIDEVIVNVLRGYPPGGAIE